MTLPIQSTLVSVLCCCTCGFTARTCCLFLKNHVQMDCVNHIGIENLLTFLISLAYCVIRSELLRSERAETKTICTQQWWIYSPVGEICSEARQFFNFTISVTSKKSPNVYKSCPKRISLEKLKTNLHKLPKMCWQLGQNNCCHGLWKVAQKVINHPIWSHFYHSNDFSGNISACRGSFGERNLLDISTPIAQRKQHLCYYDGCIT